MRAVQVKSVQPPIPAAEYVRMSTDYQEYSIENQRATISKYAADHGYIVVATYSDPGRSGVRLKGRPGLAQLLKDVVSGNAPFRAILVYDVSRWGRFQDLDEAAHYEFLCKCHGAPIRYCAEEFVNEQGLPNLVMKALKRTMAAEYSRELGVKVFAGMANLARLGFRTAGDPGYGLRRLMVSPNGQKRVILEPGEQKSLKNHHNIVVPGPDHEVEIVRKMFSMALQKKTSCDAIARELNRIGVLDRGKGRAGRLWCGNTVNKLLRNERYMGCSIYGKTTKKLGGPTQRKDRSEWIVIPNSFSPIIEPTVFKKVQERLNARCKSNKTDEYYLKRLRRVLSRHGKITGKLAKAMGIDSHTTLMKRFGSAIKAYELVGFKPSHTVLRGAAMGIRIRHKYNEVFASLEKLYPNTLRIVRLKSNRQLLEFDGKVRVAVQICLQIKPQTISGSRWLLRAQPLEAGCPTLICLLDKDNKKIARMYIVPHFMKLLRRYKNLKEGHKFLEQGKEITDLATLREVAITFNREWQEREDTTVVGDVVFNARTPDITIGGKHIMFAPIEAELFKQLVRNAGKVLSNKQLVNPFNGSEYAKNVLGAYICTIRKRLGHHLRDRIVTEINSGYKYVFPEQAKPKDSELNEWVLRL